MTTPVQSGQVNSPGSRLSLALGMLAPSLQEQCGHLLPEQAQDDLAHLQLDNEAISRLLVRGCLIQSAADKARDKLFDKVIALLKKHAAIKVRQS